MESPLGPLMANAVMCSIQEKLEKKGKMEVSVVANMDEAHIFHKTLHNAHPSLSFTMEVQNENGQPPFLGTMLTWHYNEFLQKADRHGSPSLSEPR